MRHQTPALPQLHGVGYAEQFGRQLGVQVVAAAQVKPADEMVAFVQQIKPIVGHEALSQENQDRIDTAQKLGEPRSRS